MYLVDVLLPSPGKTAGVVATKHQQRRMVGVCVGREDGRRALRVVCVGTRPDCVQQYQRGPVRAFRHSRH